MFNYDTSKKTAEFLLQIKAIILQPKNPFIWSSGIKSPIYCDNRRILSFPKIRTYVRHELTNIINENFAKPDVIAGVATGGIAHGVLVAQDLGLPFVYVRSAEKSHGLQNKIEGVIDKGQSVIVIEDLVSTGKSSLRAVNALKERQCEVKGLVTIFSYGFKETEEEFKKARCKFICLTNYKILIKQALEKNFISQKDMKILEDWAKNPAKWESKK